MFPPVRAGKIKRAGEKAVNTSFAKGKRSCVNVDSRNLFADVAPRPVGPGGENGVEQ